MIITKEDINTLCRQCTTDDAAANNVIKETEIVDIKPQIGTPLYNAILDDADKFKDLLNGCTYVDKNGVTQSHAGLKTAEAYYAASRIVRSTNGVMSRYGYVVKTDDYSTASDTAKVTSDSSYFREFAGNVMHSIVDYIQCNKDNAPFVGLVQTAPGRISQGFTHVDVIGD